MEFSAFTLAVLPRCRSLLHQLLQLSLLGLLVGVACWPFNLLDRWQDGLLQRLPAFSGSAWQPHTLLLALAPVLVVPVLLVLQRGPLLAGAGSGIPQTIASIEDPLRARQLLGLGPSLQRCLLWSLATLSLLPLGREGPVVQVGAAVARWLRGRYPHWLPDLSHADLLAVAAGAGLAAGFDTPLVGVLFVAEEFTSRFTAALLWPAMVICAVAASFSNLTGQPEFALGTLGVEPIQLIQVLWAVPIGALAGLLGAVFGWLLLAATRRCVQIGRRWPLRLGIVLGAALSLLIWLSGGAGGGDGEALLALLLSGQQAHGLMTAGLGGQLLTLLLRVVGPVLALACGIPGGLIDPAISFGAILGQTLAGAAGAPTLGLALGMAAGLAGATQLPVVSVAFCLRLAGDQQLLPGLVVAAVLAALVSRQLLRQPIYHALADATGFASQRPA